MKVRAQGIFITCTTCKTGFVRPYRSSEMIVACPTCRGLFTVSARDLKAAMLRTRSPAAKQAV